MSETPRRKVGRPAKPPTPGHKTALGLRVTPQIKQALDTAASVSGRTQSQEAEYRLEQTFDHRPLHAAMELAFGKELGGILIVVGEAMARTRDLRLTAGEDVGEPWLFNEMVRAACLVFEAFRPDGEIVAPQHDQYPARGPGAKGSRLITVGRKLEDLSIGEYVARLRLLNFVEERLQANDPAAALLGEALIALVKARVE